MGILLSDSCAGPWPWVQSKPNYRSEIWHIFRLQPEDVLWCPHREKARQRDRETRRDRDRERVPNAQLWSYSANASCWSQLWWWEPKSRVSVHQHQSLDTTMAHQSLSGALCVSSAYLPGLPHLWVLSTLPSPPSDLCSFILAFEILLSP